MPPTRVVSAVRSVPSHIRGGIERFKALPRSTKARIAGAALIATGVGVGVHSVRYADRHAPFMKALGTLERMIALVPHTRRDGDEPTEADFARFRQAAQAHTDTLSARLAAENFRLNELRALAALLQDEPAAPPADPEVVHVM